jgi:hypothetical protein
MVIDCPAPSVIAYQSWSPGVSRTPETMPPTEIVDVVVVFAGTSTNSPLPKRGQRPFAIQLLSAFDP